MFTQNDLLQIKQLGISEKTIETQINNFINGFPYMNITAACEPGKGILPIEDPNLFINIYEQAINNCSVIKFVPASGAASRMFKELFDFCEKHDNSQEITSKGVIKFFNKIHDFAFYNELNKLMLNNTGESIEQAIENKNYKEIINLFLMEKGMNYGNKPKALLTFHKYDTNTRTAIEEHIVEAANYATNQGIAKIHFTISPEHKEGVINKINEVLHAYETLFNIKFHITYSIQKASTDTIAVNSENQPFRTNDGHLLFRPAGHGALIENLNDIDEDIIFIKNIDNVVPDRIKEETFRYKKIIGGVLIHYKNLIFNYIEKLEKNPTTELITEIVDFFRTEICFIMPPYFVEMNMTEKVKYLIDMLNRPIRVCGMVKNEGEPGGGPFWATNNDESISLQVVEMSQINTKDLNKKQIVATATHFNPVDLVCWVKNYKGQKFNLKNFIDPDTGFISIKSKDGKELKAQELPGLWNGAMASWNTIFVEVPIITFNPVKEVNDLLRENHQ